MNRIAPYTLGYIYAVLVLAGVAFRGWTVLLPVLLTFVILPVVDHIFGINPWNPQPAGERELIADRRFQWITWAWLPIGAAVTLYSIAVATGADWHPSERVGLAVGLGLMNSVAGIVYAHELVHQTARWETLLGEAILTLVSYTHFRVEHVYGHHRYVATPHDPATARYNESFYAFLPRSVFGQIVSAWKLEAARLVRAEKPVWSVHNRMLWYGAVLLGVYALLYVTTGSIGAGLFALQSIVAFCSLEITNYLEHYGLVRKELSHDAYETVGPQHSWNSAHRVSNYMLINLARHSDHHAKASRRYQILRTYSPEIAPQLPSGYAAMYMLALLPPAWFAVMNPRVKAWEAAHR